MIKHHAGHEGHNAVLLVLVPMRVCACYMSSFHNSSGAVSQTQLGSDCFLSPEVMLWQKRTSTTVVVTQRYYPPPLEALCSSFFNNPLQFPTRLVWTTPSRHNHIVSVDCFWKPSPTLPLADLNRRLHSVLLDLCHVTLYVRHVNCNCADRATFMRELFFIFWRFHSPNMLL